MKTLRTLFASLALVAIAHAGEFPDSSIEELKAAIEAKKVTLIDVNGPQSYKKGHIPSAVEFGTIKGDLTTALPKDKKALVVAYCGGPTCQAYTAAATAAKKLGYKNVKHLSAGISGWVQAGEKTEKVN